MKNISFIVDTSELISYFGDLIKWLVWMLSCCQRRGPLFQSYQPSSVMHLGRFWAWLQDIYGQPCHVVDTMTEGSDPTFPTDQGIVSQWALIRDLFIQIIDYDLLMHEFISCSHIRDEFLLKTRLTLEKKQVVNCHLPGGQPIRNSCYEVIGHGQALDIWPLT